MANRWKIWTVRGLAKRAGLTKQAVYAAVKRGEIEPAMSDRPMLFAEEDALEWLRWRKEVAGMRGRGRRRRRSGKR